MEVPGHKPLQRAKFSETADKKNCSKILPKEAIQAKYAVDHPPNTADTLK
jgi:hypothetical protein